MRAVYCALLLSFCACSEVTREAAPSGKTAAVAEQSEDSAKALTDDPVIETAARDALQEAPRMPKYDPDVDPLAGCETHEVNGVRVVVNPHPIQLNF